MKDKGSSGLLYIYEKFEDLVEHFEVFMLSISVFAMASLVIINVIARTFYRSIYFAEELTELFTILITFVGVSYAVRKARHIRMGAFFDAVPHKFQKVMILIISGVSAVVMFLLASYSYSYMDQARIMNHVTPALRMPYWLFLIIVPIGFFFAGIQYVRTIVKNIVEYDVWLSPEQQGEYEAEELQQIAEKYEGISEELAGHVGDSKKQEEDNSVDSKDHHKT
ncbi:MAG: TRAP transporter small permease [Bacillota bacterium]